MEKKRFLIVEDDVETSEIIKLVFKDHDVTVAHTLAGARPPYHSQHFDIFMLDNWLPDGSGIEFCREIRARNPDSPIIFTSAAAQAQNIQEATDAGATRYLTKPFDPYELQEIVKELLG